MGGGRLADRSRGTGAALRKVTKDELASLVGTKQKAYKEVFGPPGTAAHEAFADLACFAHAFDGEQPSGVSLERLAGRREAYFHIWKHLNLAPIELLAIYQKALRLPAVEE